MNGLIWFVFLYLDGMSITFNYFNDVQNNDIEEEGVDYITDIYSHKIDNFKNVLPYNRIKCTFPNHSPSFSSSWTEVALLSLFPSSNLTRSDGNYFKSGPLKYICLINIVSIENKFHILVLEITIILVDTK